MSLTEIHHKNLNEFKLTQDGVCWQDFVIIVMNILVL